MAKRTKIEIPLLFEDRINRFYIVPHGGMTDEILQFIITSASGNEFYDNNDFEFSNAFYNWHNVRSLKKDAVCTIHNYITIVKGFSSKKVSSEKFIECLDLAAQNGWTGMNTTWDCYRSIINGTQQQPPQQPTQKNGNGNTNNINNLFANI